MRIHKLIIVFSICLTASRSMAQTTQAPPAKYRKFAIYVGVGPSYFFNNLVISKNDVSPWGYAGSFRVMWEPQHSFLSLGLESGYNRVYSVSTTSPVEAKVVNTSIPLLFIVSMKFSPEVYASWSMGQSFNFNKVTATGYSADYNANYTSLADFSATIGYRFIQKERISYAAELKGYYSSKYANGTIAVLFIVGFKL
jgi:hypothetical protein